MDRRPYIHPFPARMAPELALSPVAALKRPSVVFDPMSGSGTVVHCAVEAGHEAIGVDSDPLAVLIGSVRTKKIDLPKAKKVAESIIASAHKLQHSEVSLPWIDKDPKTTSYVDFWFGDKQKQQLRCISRVLYEQRFARAERRSYMDLVKVALSRIIITKESAASLARDTSHSRPHRVADSSDYDVFSGLTKSLSRVLTILEKDQPKLQGTCVLAQGDARNVRSVCDNGSVDLVVTSPPYLNAIDYMRGHRLSLVWLGFSVGELSGIRSSSIGAEVGLDCDSVWEFSTIVDSMADCSLLPNRTLRMINRYAEDTYRFLSEIARVLKPGGKAVLVVGDSCHRGVYIRNSEAVKRAAKMVGLEVTTARSRPLPSQSRYLPTPIADNPLSKRMRTESIIYLRK